MSIVTEERPSVAPVYLLLFWFLATMVLWGFAFYHSPAATPEWLRRAQAACFGTDATGLPDTYGWTVLVIAPLSMLFALWTAFRVEIMDGYKELWQRNGWRLYISVLMAILIAESVWISIRISEGLAVLQTTYEAQSDDRLPPAYPRIDKKAPDFNLVDQSGKQISLKQFQGKFTVVSFFFAHCQTVCPVLIKTVQEASAKLQGQDIPVLMITLDPWRDTPADLPSISKAWGFTEGQHLLSGPVESVTKVIKDFEVPTERSEKNGDITHPATVYVINPKGEIVYSFNNPPPLWLVDAISRLKQEAAQG